MGERRQSVSSIRKNKTLSILACLSNCFRCTTSISKSGRNKCLEIRQMKAIVSCVTYGWSPVSVWSSCSLSSNCSLQKQNGGGLVTSPSLLRYNLIRLNTIQPAKIESIVRNLMRMEYRGSVSVETRRCTWSVLGTLLLILLTIAGFFFWLWNRSPGPIFHQRFSGRAKLSCLRYHINKNILETQGSLGSPVVAISTW